MTTLRTLALASAAVVVMAGSSFAADIIAPAPRIIAPPPVVVPTWSGFYLGVHGGGGWSATDSTFQSGADSPADFRIDGPYVGGQVGFNWELNTLVLGIEADASWSGIHGSRNPSNSSAPFTTNQDLDWFGTVRGRLGLAMGNWMPYITGGWAWGQGSRFNSGVDETVTANHSGWTAGAGIEWMMTPHLTWKAEYKFLNLRGGDYNFSSNPSTVDIPLHTVELGINFKF